MLNVEQPKVPDDEAGRSFVSPEALDTMLAACRRSRPPSFIDRRDLALLLLLRHSGLRRSEAAALLLTDVPARRWHPDRPQGQGRQGSAVRVQPGHERHPAALHRTSSGRSARQAGPRGAVRLRERTRAHG